MRSEKEIEDRIKEITSDERYNYPPATIQTNAPLALIQLEMETKVTTLKWVLNSKKEG